MKKLFGLFCMFLCISSVGATDYYSDYSDFSDWSLEYVEPSDTVLVETNQKYKYYREEISGDYYIEGENNSEYPFSDKNNYIYSDYSEYSEKYPENKPNREIETIDGYKYQEAEKVRYIVFDNINGSYGSLRINELSIKDKNGNNIEFWNTCYNCNDHFIEYATNGIYEENESYIENGGSLIIDLTTYYAYDDVYITMGVFDVGYETKTFNITFYHDLNEEKLLDVSISDDFVLQYFRETIIYNFNYTNMNKYNINWDEPIITTEKVLPSETVKVNIVPLYRYRDIYYYYYKVDKYYSDYMDYNTDEYPNKSDEFITYFRYKTREKTTVVDNIVITNYDINLEDYVESTTDVNIETNIDINKNGTYYVDYTTSYIKIRKDVVVNIEANNLRDENQRLLEEYTLLLKRYDDLLLELEDLERVNQNNNNEYQKLSELFVDLQNKYSELQNVVNNLTGDLANEQFRYEQLLNEYNNLLLELEDLERINQNNNNEYQKLSELFVDLQNKYRDLQSIVNNLNNTIANMEDENNELTNNYNNLLEQYNSAVEEIDNLNNKIKEQESIYREYEHLNNVYITLQEQYQNLEKIIADLTNDLNGEKIEKEKILEDYNKALETINVLNNKISEQEIIKNEYDTLLIKYEDLQNKLNELNNNLNNTTDIKQYNIMIEEINNYKLQIDELNMELEKYKKSLDDKEEEKNKMSKEFENELINIKIKNENQIKKLQDEIENKNEVKTIPLLSISNIPIIIIIIIFIILTLFVLFSLKMKDNN